MLMVPKKLLEDILDLVSVLVVLDYVSDREMQMMDTLRDAAKGVQVDWPPKK